MRKILFSLFLAISLGFLQIPTASAISIGFSPNATINASNGNNYSIDIVLSGLGTGGIVSAFNIDVRYDSSILNMTSLTFGTMLGSYDSNLLLTQVLQGSSTSTPGVINLAAVSLLSDINLQALQGTGSITLATLNFSAIAAGTTDLTFDWYLGRDIKGNNNDIIFGYGAVPEPGTLLLLGSGMTTLFLVKRRKQSK